MSADMNHRNPFDEDAKSNLHPNNYRNPRLQPQIWNAQLGLPNQSPPHIVGHSHAVIQNSPNIGPYNDYFYVADQSHHSRSFHNFYNISTPNQTDANPYSNRYYNRYQSSHCHMLPQQLFYNPVYDGSNSHPHVLQNAQTPTPPRPDVRCDPLWSPGCVAGNHARSQTFPDQEQFCFISPQHHHPSCPKIDYAATHHLPLSLPFGMGNQKDKSVGSYEPRYQYVGYLASPTSTISSILTKEETITTGAFKEYNRLNIKHTYVLKTKHMDKNKFLYKKENDIEDDMKPPKPESCPHPQRLYLLQCKGQNRKEGNCEISILMVRHIGVLGIYIFTRSPTPINVHSDIHHGIGCMRYRSRFLQSIDPVFCQSTRKNHAAQIAVRDFIVQTESSPELNKGLRGSVATLCKTGKGYQQATKALIDMKSRRKRKLEKIHKESSSFELGSSIARPQP